MKPGPWFALLLLPLAAACTSGPLVKAALDDEVRRLCAIDGGIKVYETVKLPADKFNQWGQANFYRPTQGENALGPAYRLRTVVDYLRKNGASIRRYHVQVIRSSDEVLLGESIGYDRGGGDIPGPWQPSSYSCPEKHGEIVIDRVFLPLDRRN